LSGKDVIRVEAVLRLSLDSERSFASFFMAISDPRTRAAIRADGEAPAAIVDVLSILDDQSLMARAKDIMVKYASFVRGETGGAQLAGASQELRSYMEASYPHGYELLRDYALMSSYSPMPGKDDLADIERFPAAAAAIYGVIDIAVWVNVVVATHVVVAAVAVAVAYLV